MPLIVLVQLRSERTWVAIIRMPCTWEMCPSGCGSWRTSFYKRKDFSENHLPPVALKKMDNILYESTYSAVISILVVGGLITIFYLLTEILCALGILSPIISLLEQLFGENVAKGVVFGAFECTRGLKTLASGETTFFTLPLCALICGFGGLSVIAQSTAYLKKAKMKTAPFILSKIIMAVIGFILGFIFSCL